MNNKETNLYNIFSSYSYNQLIEMFKHTKTKEEQNFYMTLANLVLQEAQKKLIKN